QLGGGAEAQRPGPEGDAPLEAAAGAGHEASAEIGKGDVEGYAVVVEPELPALDDEATDANVEPASAPVAAQPGDVVPAAARRRIGVGVGAAPAASAATWMSTSSTSKGSRRKFTEPTETGRESRMDSPRATSVADHC